MIPSVIGDVAASLEQLPVEVDAQVREREQRHDHVARPRVQAVLEPLVDRQRGCDADLGRAGELGRRLLAERARLLGRSLERPARGRIGGRGEPDDEAGDHRIDAGLVQRDPDPHAQQSRHLQASRDRHEAQPEQDREQAERDQQRHELDVLGVDGRDHDQRHEVVDDDEREEPNAQARRLRRHQRQHAEGEGRVGRHRGAPAVRRCLSGVDREVDEHRHGESAERGQHRDRHAAPVAQLAQVELALRLEPDHQEEQRHEALVDPVAQVERQRVVADADRQVGGPERLVGLPPGQVGPDESGDRRGQERERAARLGVEEAAHRRGEIARPGRALPELRVHGRLRVGTDTRRRSPGCASWPPRSRSPSTPRRRSTSSSASPSGIQLHHVQRPAAHVQSGAGAVRRCGRQRRSHSAATGSERSAGPGRRAATRAANGPPAARCLVAAVLISAAMCARSGLPCRSIGAIHTHSTGRQSLLGRPNALRRLGNPVRRSGGPC